MALCADCNLRRCSSVVFIIVPRLPWLPGFNGKLINPSNLLFRSLIWPDCVNVSQVGVLDFQRSTNVCRFKFNAAALTPGSVDLLAMFRVVSGWLHGMGTSQVSHFMFLCLIDTDALDLEHYRYDLQPATSTPGSNDPIGSFWVISVWLHDSAASQVSISVRFHPINISRYDFDSTTLTPGSNDPIGTYGVGLGWLRESGMSTVSDFIFSEVTQGRHQGQTTTQRL